MGTAYVFGYGSLVNASTHDYPALHPARIRGWKRRWRHVEGRSVAFLTVVEATGEIDGMVAEVPGADWDALDLRERSYLRASARDVTHTLDPTADIRIYHAPEHLHRPHSTHHPILLSYVDVVVQGYARAFGEAGVRRFFETTEGWDAPILNDRAAPRYSRHQALTADETALADQCLQDVRARIVAF